MKTQKIKMAFLEYLKALGLKPKKETIAYNNNSVQCVISGCNVNLQNFTSVKRTDDGNNCLTRLSIDDFENKKMTNGMFNLIIN